MGNQTLLTPTSLDNIATSGQVSPDEVTLPLPLFPPSDNEDLCPDCSYSDWREGGVKELMLETRRAYSVVDAVWGGNFVERMSKCRTHADFKIDPETGKLHLISNSCRVPFCPYCAEARARFVGWNACEFFEKQPWKGHMVLTTVSVAAEDLAERVDDIKKWRAKLMGSALWKNNNMTGSFWVVQPQPKDDGKYYNVHIHALVTGAAAPGRKPGLPQRQLSAKWKKITGHSDIVFIRQVRNLSKAVSDITRYVGRPGNLLDIDYENQAEFIHAMEGKRIVGTTGICTAKKGGIVLHHVKRDPDETQLVRLARVETIWALVRAGNEDAKTMLRCYGTGEALPEGVWDRCRAAVCEIEGRFAGLSEASTERGPPESAQMSFEMESANCGFGSSGGW